MLRAVAWPHFVSHKSAGMQRRKHCELLPQALTIAVPACAETRRELLAQPVNTVVVVQKSNHAPRSGRPLSHGLLPRHTHGSLLGQLPPEPSDRCLVEKQVRHVGRLLRSVVAPIQSEAGSFRRGTVRFDSPAPGIEKAGATVGEESPRESRVRAQHAFGGRHHARVLPTQAPPGRPPDYSRPLPVIPRPPQ